MKRTKQFTIVQLEAQLQESLNFIFGSKVEIDHGLSAERGGKKLFGRHTCIGIPLSENPVITRRQKKAAKKAVAGLYDKVKRVVVEQGTIQYGSSQAPVMRRIRFEHE